MALIPGSDSKPADLIQSIGKLIGYRLFVDTNHTGTRLQRLDEFRRNFNDEYMRAILLRDTGGIGELSLRQPRSRRIVGRQYNYAFFHLDSSFVLMGVRTEPHTPSGYRSSLA